ncbi:MAG: ROK family protein [Blastocatellia bacterium]
MNHESLYLGVDLGGTQLRLAAVTGAGRVVSDVLTVRTGPAFSPAELSRQLGELTDALRSQTGATEFAALGMGITGIVSRGVMSQSEFLPLLNDVDLSALVAPVLNCPVTIENDARCFVLAEARFGAARGAQNVCGITLGTGAGGGVMIDGRLIHGVSAQAGEVWNIPLRGKFLEYFLSGFGVVREYFAAIGRPDDGSLDSAQIAELARQGDAAARQVWAAFGDDLYALCQTMISLLDPEVIVIGGSLAKARDLYLDEVKLKLGKMTARIRLAELGDAAGLIGAAALNIPASS